ncbi:MAG: polysaccharide deacetylase family protein [Bacteroidia bacterium]
MKIMTIDVEEWFHILKLNSGAENQWSTLESRIEKGINDLLDIFEKYDVKATFFCLGSVAKSHPWVIKKISTAGHEIGSHGYSHDLIPMKPSVEFTSDLTNSIDILEQTTGEKIISYRAPGFSVSKENLWIFDLLLESGIQIDSSIVIGKSDYGGLPQFKYNTPFQLKLNNGIIKEFPINTFSFLGLRTIFGGGGYFRFFPYYIIKKWTAESSYAMAYFHYRDFDTGQPVFKDLGTLKRFKTYYGIDSCMEKLDNYLNDFKFINVEEADKNIDWTKTKTINLQESFQVLSEL